MRGPCRYSFIETSDDGGLSWERLARVHDRGNHRFTAPENSSLPKRVTTFLTREPVAKMRLYRIASV